MDRYLEQLIEDLKAAQKLVPKVEDSPPKDIIEELEELDRMLMIIPKTTMQDFFGIDVMYFPPREKLTKEQAAVLTHEILELWGIFNITATFPANFPLDQLYSMLVEEFKKPFQYYAMGHTGIEFCDYEPERCPFGDAYCQCKELHEEWEEMEKQNLQNKQNDDEDSLPF